MNNKLPLSLVFSFALLGCTHGELSREDLRNFIGEPSNGLIKSADSNGYTVTCAYQPVDLVFSNELAIGNRFDQRRDSLRKLYNKIYYFRLAISRDGKSIEQSFASIPGQLANLTSHLSSTIGKDLQMQTGENTATVVDFIYSPFYGSSSATQILFAFETSQDVSGEVKIIYDDSFVGVGRIEFLFNASDIRKTPLLRSNN
ncbi:MAG: hypothetical protein U0U09_04500 [Cyclobacteriaceae bacterium]